MSTSPSSLVPDPPSCYYVPLAGSINTINPDSTSPVRGRGVTFCPSVQVSMFQSSLDTDETISISSSSTSTVTSSDSIPDHHPLPNPYQSPFISPSLPSSPSPVFSNHIHYDPITSISPLNSLPPSPLIAYHLNDSPPSVPIFPSVPSSNLETPVINSTTTSSSKNVMCSLYDIISLIPAFTICLILWWLPDLVWDSDHAHPLRLPFRLLGAFLLVAIGSISSTYSLTCLVLFALTLLALTMTAVCSSEHDNHGFVPCKSSHETMRALLEGYSDPIQWLVIASFQLGLAVQTSGLGYRVCTYLLKWTSLRFQSILALSYAILTCEYILALAVPSNTARGAGIMSAIVSSIATLSTSPLSSLDHDTISTDSDSNHQDPHHNDYDLIPIRFRIRNYWSLIGAYANVLSASAHMSGMAAGPMIMRLIQERLHIDLRPLHWTLGAFMPWLGIAAFVPWIAGWATGVNVWQLKLNSPPDDEESDQSHRHSLPMMSTPVIDYEIEEAIDQGIGNNSVECQARETLLPAINSQRESPLSLSLSLLQQYYPTTSWTSKELQVSIILVICIISWSLSEWDPSAIALAAMCAVIGLRIVSVEKILANSDAWNTYLWLGGMMSLTAQLERSGVTMTLGSFLANLLLGDSIGGIIVVVSFINVYSMFAFSSLTAHVAIIGPPIISAMHHALTAVGDDQLPVTGGNGVPWAVGIVFAMTLILGGCLTPYSTGSVALYAAASTLPPFLWIRIGIVFCLLAVFIVLTLGSSWWFLLGWWSVPLQG